MDYLLKLRNNKYETRCTCVSIYYEYLHYTLCATWWNPAAHNTNTFTKTLLPFYFLWLSPHLHVFFVPQSRVLYIFMCFSVTLSVGWKYGLLRYLGTHWKKVKATLASQQYVQMYVRRGNIRPAICYSLQVVVLLRVLTWCMECHYVMVRLREG